LKDTAAQVKEYVKFMQRHELAYEKQRRVLEMSRQHLKATIESVSASNKKLKFGCFMDMYRSWFLTFNFLTIRRKCSSLSETKL
jgi:hypothetical protein